MSLLLRQACQKSLDDFGLNNYHVRINEHSKTLTVVGECGAELINVHGIRFSRNTPTKDETEYAATLLDAFMGKHGVDVKDFITRNTLLKNTPKPVAKDGENYDSSYEGYDEDNMNLYSYEYTSIMGPFSVTVYTQDSNIAMRTTNGPKPEKEALAYRVTHAMLKVARKKLQVYADYKVLEEEVDFVKSKLSKCDI